MGTEQPPPLTAMNTETSDPEVLLTLKEFSDLFQRGLKGIYRAIHKGRCPEAKLIANQWYIRVTARDLQAARNRSLELRKKRHLGE